MNQNRALVVGAAGLTGGKLLSLLLESPAHTEVIAVVRSPLNLQHPKLKQLVLDFEAVEEWGEEIAAEEVYLCLGTTIRKAGSVAAFRAVDVELTIAIAKRCQLFVHSAVVLSSLGASSAALNFYRKAKGDMESRFIRLDIPRKVVVRPSLLLGERKEKRWAEHLGKFMLRIFRPLLRGRWQKYRAIEAETVARAMLHLGTDRSKGIYFYESNDLERFGSRP